MRIIHISDLHVKTSIEKNDKIELLFQNIEKFDPDHILITGDITDSGTEGAYEESLRILKESGYYSSRKMTVVPGNHDLFTHFYKNKYLNFIKNKLKESNYTKEDYKEDVEYFDEYFGNLMCNMKTPNDQPYPFLKNLNKDIVIIGINSCAKPNKLNNTCSNGYVNIEKLDSFLKSMQEKNLMENKVKIAILHHSLFDISEIDPIQVDRELLNRLKDSLFMPEEVIENRDDLIDLFKEYDFNLILHGHEHLSYEYSDDDGELVIFCAGGTRHGIYFNVIDIENFEINIRIVEECEECKGWGGVECTECEGTHKIECPACEGNDVECPACDGYGELDCDNCGDQGKVACEYCSGGGWVECKSCGGNGCNICKGNGIECPVCQGNEEVDCPYCVNDNIWCPICNGKGIINCTLCNGKTTVKCTRCDKEGDMICEKCGGSGSENTAKKCKNCKNGIVYCDECEDGIKSCDDCDSLGWIECDICNGDGGVPCPECKGKKEINCDACNGNGCETCNYYGKVPCENCNYLGIVYCQTCDSLGIIFCGTCLGDGNLWCEKCQATGVIFCCDCEGSEKINI